MNRSLAAAPSSAQMPEVQPLDCLSSHVRTAGYRVTPPNRLYIQQFGRRPERSFK